MPETRLEAELRLRRSAARLGGAHPGRDIAMRVLFFGWLLLIATGLVFYSVIGLSHN